MRVSARQVFVRALAVGALSLVSGATVNGQRGPLGSSTQLAGSAPSPTHGTGLIVGQVVDGVTGRPVGGAIVTLNLGAGAGAAPTTVRGQPVPAGPGAASSNTTGRVLADGEGRFVFYDLPAGRANLSASAPGYMQGVYGSRQPNGASHPIVLADGERLGEVTIRLWKLATISGTVVDEAGDPLIGVSVTAERVSTDGTRRTNSAGLSSTDDRGIYHFLLPAGDYLVLVPATSTSVPLSSIETFERALTTPGQVNQVLQSLNASGAPMPNGPGTRIGTMQFQTTGSMGRNAPPLKENGPILAYQTTFYPNAFSPSAAQAISLAPGDEHPNVDLTMRLVPTSRVSGTVVGPEGTGGNLGLRLVPADSSDPSLNNSSPTASTLSDASGSFTFLGVPAGQYELQVTRVPRPIFLPPGLPASGAGPNAETTQSEPTLWARMPISVEGSDIGGVTVTLRTGVRVTGRVEFDGAAPKPTADRFATATLILQDLDNQGQPILPTRMGQDGLFTTQGVIPGHYLLTVGGNFGREWNLRSVMANGHDLSASPQLLESDVQGAVATFTDHPNQVDVSVDPAGTSADNSQLVVFFPANYQAWLAAGTAGRLSGAMRVDAAGHILLRSLPAADYDFAAISSDFSQDWKDPKILEAIAREATHVSLGDSDHRTVELKPVAIR